MKPSKSSLHSDGLLAVVAGSDTTATTLSSVIYFLLLNTEKFKRLRREIDNYFPPGEGPMDPTQMVGMPYLNGCM